MKLDNSSEGRLIDERSLISMLGNKKQLPSVLSTNDLIIKYKDLPVARTLSNQILQPLQHTRR